MSHLFPFPGALGSRTKVIVLLSFISLLTYFDTGKLMRGVSQQGSHKVLASHSHLWGYDHFGPLHLLPRTRHIDRDERCQEVAREHQADATTMGTTGSRWRRHGLHKQHARRMDVLLPLAGNSLGNDEDDEECYDMRVSKLRDDTETTRSMGLWDDWPDPLYRTQRFFFSLWLVSLPSVSKMWSWRLLM
jgi:hypothetical protein